MADLNKPYRTMTKQERAVHDAFYGGYCCALSAATYGYTGSETDYVEAVAAAGDDLLRYAKRQNDMELPKIKRAVKWLKDYEERRAFRDATPTERTDK